MTGREFVVPTLRVYGCSLEAGAHSVEVRGDGISASYPGCQGTIVSGPSATSNSNKHNQLQSRKALLTQYMDSQSTDKFNEVLEMRQQLCSSTRAAELYLSWK